MSTRRWLGALGIAGIAGALVIYRTALGDLVFDRGEASGAHDESVVHYTCPMDPSVAATRPSACPICGMALTPVAKEDRATDVVRIGWETRQRIGARVVSVESRQLKQRVAAVGVLQAAAAGASGSAAPCVGACDHLLVDAEVYQGMAIEVPVGQVARVTAAEIPLTAFTGKVVAGPAGRVRIEVANPDQALRAGMHVDVQLDIQRSPQLVVPAEAVVYAGSRRLVFVDRGGGQLEPRAVTLGFHATGLVEVLEGVAAGDQVLATGTFLVAAESRIRSAGTLWTEPVASPRRAPAKTTAP